MKISAISNVNTYGEKYNNPTSFKANFHVDKVADTFIRNCNKQLGEYVEYEAVTSHLNKLVDDVFTNVRATLSELKDTTVVKLITNGEKLALTTEPPLFIYGENGKKGALFALKFPYTPANMKHLEGESLNLVNAVAQAKMGTPTLTSAGIIAL